MHHKKLLLVIDDCWDPAHELMVNFIDVESGSKVLLSSRVRNVLDEHSVESSAIVNIELPTEEDAVRMLKSTAGLPEDGDVPAQARELVKFCKFLPLSISIAGKLVADLGIGLESDDWVGIVEMMREEFADEKRTVEESVIATSLNGIRGPHKDNVLHLFKSLALLGEDIVVPLPIVSMMYESIPRADGSFAKRPTILMTRRWMKQLIDRSVPVYPTCIFILSVCRSAFTVLSISQCAGHWFSALSTGPSSSKWHRTDFDVWIRLPGLINMWSLSCCHAVISLETSSAL